MEKDAIVPDFIPDSEFKPDSTPPTSSQGTEGFIPDSQFVADEDKYGGAGEMAKTFAEGVASSATMGLSTGAERLAGIEPEAILGRREANPITHALGQVAGLAAPAAIEALTGGAATPELLAARAAGQAVESSLYKYSAQGVIDKVAARAAEQLGATGLAGSAVKGIVSNAIFQGGDEVSKMLSSDPHQSAQTAAMDVGLSGLLGGALGSALHGTHALWESTAGNKVGQLIEDFKGRIQEHLENPEPANALTNELDQFYRNTKDVADEVFGPSGLKAQDISKAMPQMSEAITNQVGEIGTKLDSAMKSLSDDPYVGKLQKVVEKFKETVGEDAGNPEAIFNATQDLKQQLQEWGKYNKTLVPLAEKDFRSTAQGLAKDLRMSLEDSAVWGKAGQRQQAINKAFTEFLPSLKDFERRFTVEVAGERQIDPGKVNTYVNQLGKANAEIKQQMLENFLKAANKYRGTLKDTHINLGLESPLTESPMQAANASLETISPGAKLADAFVKKGIGKLVGGAVGGTLGSYVGHTVLGALIGEHTLSPFFDSVLPALIKPLLGNKASAAGLKEAAQYGINVAKGESSLEQAAKNVFKASKEVGTGSAVKDITESNVKRLDKMLKAAQVDPSQLMQGNSKLDDYLPGHSTAVAFTTGKAVEYLNSLRPNETKQAPLDASPKANSIAKAKYVRALSIAENPLSILQHVKEGTILPSDLTTLDTIYPQLRAKFAKSLEEHMIAHVTKGGQVPLSQAQGLSLLAGHPLNSTVMPFNIISNQGVYLPSGNPQQSNGGPSRGSKGQSNALAKLPSMYNTPGQAREQTKLGSKA